MRPAAFEAAYDAVLARWPVEVESFDVTSEFGRTQVHRCGPPDAPPLLLLAAGGATSTVWLNDVARLSRAHRVYAVDTIGQAGRSVLDGRPVKRPADLMDWLDAIATELRLGQVDVCGHSYGGWLALSWALHAPARVRRLVLLDPTDCFAGLAVGYRLRAVPLFAAPSPQRWAKFLDWETGGAPVDAGWRELAGLGAGLRGGALVLPRRPRGLDDLRVPTLVLLAEYSRAHDPVRVAEGARTHPGVSVVMLPGTTHHSIPTVDAERLDRAILSFLDAP